MKLEKMSTGVLTMILCLQTPMAFAQASGAATTPTSSATSGTPTTAPVSGTSAAAPTSAASAPAAPAAPTALTGKQIAALDLTALADYVKPMVWELSKSMYVWSWFNSAGRNAVWTTHYNSDDSAGYTHVNSDMAPFWQAYCATTDTSLNPADCDPTINVSYGNGDMEGTGLYAAVDPIATNAYGGGSGWNLMQIQLPAGYRLAVAPDSTLNGLVTQTANATSANFPAALTQLYASVPCLQNSGTLNASPQGVFSWLLGMHSNYSYYYAGSTSSVSDREQCKVLTRKLFKEILKVDGIVYHYGGTNFSTCTSNLATNQNRQMAFVLGSPTGISASNVRVFNSQTTDDVADRIRILSLFYLNSQDTTNSANILATYTAYYRQHPLPAYPNVYIQSAQYLYDATTANKIDGLVLSFYNYASSTYEEVEVPVPTLPGPATVLSASTFPTSLVSSGLLSNNSLLWPDLEGKSIDTGLATWMKTNMLQCDSVPSFVQAQ